MEVYFDNSATTRCYDSVKDIVVKAMTEDFGNPSAMHLKGVEAEKYIKNSAESLARLLKVQEKEILFTSGGTESDNLALIGAAMANKRSGNHIITTSVEHPAVSQPALFLQEQGFEVTYLPVDSRGVVKVDALKAVLREDTILVSVMYVNNEVGAVMPVEEIAALVHEKSPKALFHVDAIQAFGKYRIHPKKWGSIFFLSVVIRFTDQRAWDFFTLMKKQRSSLRSWEADSREGCVPEQTMCRELQDLVLLPWKFIKTWKKMWKTCIGSRNTLCRDLKRSGISVLTEWSCEKVRLRF